jgi:hypothetical protein
MANGANISYLHAGSISPDLRAVTAYMGVGVEDGEQLMREPANDPTVTWLWRTDAIAPDSTRGLLQVEVNSAVVDGAPAVWFVWVDEPTVTPRATNLVAFVDDRVAPGTILSGHQFAALGVGNDIQVGAIRWYPETGLIHQVFVAPDFRRQQLGTVLLYAASALHQSHSWPGKIHADGRRTELGQQFAAGLRHPHRLQPQDDVMPPMDA